MKPPRLVAALAVLVLVAAGCSQTISGTGTTASSAPSSGLPKPTGQSVDSFHLTDCTHTSAIQSELNAPAALKAKLQISCGTLAVPLDYANPNGRKIDIQVARIHDTADAHPIGSLFLNPGGPGEPGYSFTLKFVGHLPVSITSRFDLIAFDPRGTGNSTPINCLTNAQRNFYWNAYVDATTPAGLAKTKTEAKRFGALCKARLGTALPYFNTVNAARDINQIRRALHEQTINYLGFSYGTELGWTYLHQFPKTARAFVLDGAVDPDTSGTTQSAEQIAGFEVAFNQFRQWCARNTQCAQIGEPRTLLKQAAAAAGQHPLATTLGNRTVSEGMLYTAVLATLYERAAWPALAVGLYEAAVQGDGTIFAKIADQYEGRSATGQYDNSLDALNTYECNDEPVHHRSTASELDIARSWARKYPDFGAESAGEVVGCSTWPAPRTPVPSPKAATPSKVLVLGNLHDPATPYQGAKDLARDLGNAVLLSWDGQGHTSYRQGSSCVDNAVNTYLLTLTPPRAGIVCPAK